MKKARFVLAFFATLLASCSGKTSSSCCRVYDSGNASIPAPFEDFSVPQFGVLDFDYFDGVNWPRYCWYMTHVAPTDARKSDGSRIGFEDVVVPYRYGTIQVPAYSKSGGIIGNLDYHVVFITYLDPANEDGRLDVDPYEAPVYRHNGIEIEFVGHRGYPFVWAQVGGMKDYRPDDHYDNMVANIFADFLDFGDAIRLDYFTDDDLMALAAKAKEVADDPNQWHWTND